MKNKRERAHVYFRKTFAMQTRYQKKAGVMILMFSKETDDEIV